MTPFTKFPPPPRPTNREMRPEDCPPAPERFVPPEIPAMVVPHKSGDAKLTDNETSFILRSTLRPHQYEDPNILKFIMSYLVCRNVSQASKESNISYSQGYNLRRNAEIHTAINKLTEKSVLKLGYDQTEVLERVQEISILDPICFENPDGSYKTHMSQIPPEARRAIKKFKVKNLFGVDPNGMRIVIGQLIEVEVWDKMKGLELLGRQTDLFKETRKIEHDVTKNMADVLLDSSRRADNRITGRDVIELTGKVEDEE